MLHFDRWKHRDRADAALLGVVFALPNFFSKETVESWPWLVPQSQINLGLDLRGGAHLLLAMETAEVRKDWLDTLRDDARKRLRDAKIRLPASASPTTPCRCGSPSPRTPMRP